LVSKLSDNKILVDKIAFEVSSEDFMDSNNSGMNDLLSKMSLAMSSQHLMLSDVISEVQGLKSTVTELCTEYSKLSNNCALAFPPLEQTSSTANPSPSSGPSVAGITKVNPRQPLKQPPRALMSVPGSKSLQVTAASSAATAEEDDIFCLSDPPMVSKPPPPKADPFLSAVKDAERSVLIHNLNLGQAPTLNPTTISSASLNVNHPLVVLSTGLLGK
jgi:hypothetical protein